jgi:acetoacetate decarboxylase
MSLEVNNFKEKQIGIPFDAPLYAATDEGTIEYRNCEALLGLFESTQELEKLVPPELEFTATPPQAAYWLAWYSFSTVGAYYEYISMVMVRDADGDFGYYIPYIYVTNEAALAGGRELFGAPKKLASMNMGKELEFIQGTVERPAGKRLATITFQPQSRMSGEILGIFLTEKIYLYSIRHLPPLKGEGGHTQLIKWYSSVKLHTDPGGLPTAWTGKTSLTYDSPSLSDPIHNLKLGTMMLSAYIQFDMILGGEKILKEY